MAYNFTTGNGQSYMIIHGNFFNVLATNSPCMGSAWIYPRTLGINGDGVIFHKSNSNISNGFTFIVYGNVGNNVALAIAGDSQLTLITNSSVTLNQWNHVAFLYNGGTKAAGLKIFINGSDGGSSYSNDATTLNPTNNNGVIYIGDNFNNGLSFDGLIAEVACWSTGTTSDIVSLSKGIKPNLIRPAQLNFYAPLVNNFNISPNYNFTVGGATSGTFVVTHPRMYY